MLFPFSVVVTIGAIGTVAVGSGGNVGTVGIIGSVGIVVHLLVGGASVVLLSWASIAGSGSLFAGSVAGAIVQSGSLFAAVVSSGSGIGF